MIKSRTELKDILLHDSINYKSQTEGWKRKIKSCLLANPISEQKHIWNYIKEMRFVEYYDFKKQHNFIYILPYLFHLFRLRKESHVTGLQIPPPIYVIRA